MWYFRAVAFDLDGTLAVSDRVPDDVLGAVDDARASRAMVLVTGRTLVELERAFPGLVEHFDSVVTENGAVLTCDGRHRETRLLHEAVDSAVDGALAARGVGSTRGQVLLAIDGRDAATAVEVIADLGLDHQVVRNRGAAMILPAGVTKGSGLEASLGALGLSAHNAAAVGDAENDLILLRTAEIGVAVADAVPSLAARADLVLSRPNGTGVIELLASPMLAGRAPLWPSRRRVVVGTTDDSVAVTVPGSQASVLIVGESGAGKSYVAGLLAERWIESGYSLLVVDPEGDHVGLGERTDVIVVDDRNGLPDPRVLLALLRPHRASVVLDLARAAPETRFDYLRRLPPAIAAERMRYGVPHWVIHDEAHEQALAEPGPTLAAGPGSCLVTWRPELLGTGSIAGFDVCITVGSSGTNGVGSKALDLSATLYAEGGSQTFSVARRSTSHVRHRRKYAAVPLPPARRFYFRDQDPSDPSAAAATLEEFHHHLGSADATAVAYHAARGDFSRWIGEVLADHALAGDVAHFERDLETRRSAAIEEARQQIQRVIRGRYLDS